MEYFGKIKDKDSWCFNTDTEMFESYIEVTEELHLEMVTRANEEQKILSADEEGNPILVDPPEPTPDAQKRIRIKELERFLSSTDWYAIRFADTGEEMPADIKQQRQDARDEISRLREELDSE